MTDTKEKIRLAKRVFVATPDLQKLINAIEEVRDLAAIDGYESLPDCIFVTGETGVGKTTLIDKYMEHNQPHDIVYGDAEGEKTIVPVLRCELPKAKHPKPVVSELLTQLGDPELSIKGDVRELTERLVKQLKSAKVELIIIDEFQHAIETTNKNVIQDIGEWFKILLNRAKIPIVFVGVPWSTPVLDVNEQLNRRVRRRFKIQNYTLDNFREFQDFIRSVSAQLPIKPFEPLESSFNAFRLFAASKGNISELMDGIIIPAAIKALRRDDEQVQLQDFIDAIDEYTDLPEQKNPFRLDVSEIVAEQQVKESSWNSEAKKQQQRVEPAEYVTVKFSQLTLNEVLSKR